jgi:hypothetical protein
MFPEIPGVLPEVPEPTAPFVDPIIQIHRGPDAFVSFHRKREEQWEDIGSMRTADLRQMFPQFVEELERDSYFSINSFYRAGTQGYPQTVTFVPSHERGNCRTLTLPRSPSGKA